MTTELLPRPVRIEAAGLSHPGKAQAANEDHFAIMTVQKSVRLRATNLVDTSALDAMTGPEIHVFVVADGMGGRSEGRLASGLAVSSVVEYLAEAIDCAQDFSFDRETAFLDTLSAAVWRGHERLQEKFAAQGQAATTLTMVTLVWPRAYVVHAGNSRGYLLRNGVLKQFTRDQTMGDDLVDRGAVTEELAKMSGLFNAPSSQVGGWLLPNVGLVDLVEGDKLLLCTDGLFMSVPGDRIASLLGRDTAGAAARALIDAALEAGGADNVTAVVACASGQV